MERKKAKEEKDKSKQRTLFSCFQRKIETPKENSKFRMKIYFADSDSIKQF